MEWTQLLCAFLLGTLICTVNPRLLADCRLVVSRASWSFRTVSILVAGARIRVAITMADYFWPHELHNVY